MSALPFRHTLAAGLLIVAPLILAVALPGALAAQTIITVSPQQCVWHAGDNPAWAAPNLDETGWQPYTRWNRSKIDPDEPHHWVRCHADLSTLRGTAHPAVQVQLLAAYQLFVNGEPIGGAGNLRSGHFSMNTIRSYPLSQSIPQPVAIALRITYRMVGTSPAGIPSDRLLKIDAGDQSALRGMRAGVIVALVSANLPNIICFSIVGVFGLVFLGLYFHGRSHRELLLLGIFSVSASVFYLDLACHVALVDFSDAEYMAIAGIAVTVLFVARIWFFFALVGRRVPLLFWILVGLVVPYMASLAVEAFLPLLQALWVNAFCLHWLGRVSEAADAAASFAPFVAFWPYSRIAPRMRPVAALCMAWGTALFFQHAALATSGHIPGFPNLQQTWLITSQSIQVVTTLCAIAALLWLLFREQRRVSDERAEMAGELQAASHVQQYLIPEQLPATPGFAIESAYRPSREVGGDFFQVLPQAADGSVLLVIGDVAGKGIEAGMLATLIVGAVRTAAAFTSDPVRILALLNERLCGRGLVTCLALRIEQDGSATLVNAGHLPPYLNGNELPIEGALPLGVISGMQFPVSRLTLSPSDSLFLMTDGVVEAQDAKGRLFGFDRTAELLHSGANGAALASAAQSFGQGDDITVLTLALSPVEVLLA